MTTHKTLQIIDIFESALGTAAGIVKRSFSGKAVAI